jgi:hypothetical protein
MLQRLPAEIPSIDIPPAPVRVYLSKFPTSMIAAICGPDGSPVQLIASRDFGDVFHVMRAWPRELAPRWAWAAWAIDIGSAQDVMTLALGNDLRGVTRTGSRFNIPLAQAIAALESAATRLGVQLAPHQQVISRAQASVGVLDDALVEAKLNGLMQDFNRAYREARERAKAAGKRFMGYSEAKRRLVAAIGHCKATGQELDWRAVLEG